MQQQPNSNPNTPNPAAEVALIVLAGMLIILGAALLYLGKIDIGFASFLFMAAFSLLGINLAYKVPSPGQVVQQNTQQVQQNAQLQNVSNLLSQALAMLPAFANLLHSHAPVALSQQQVQAQPTAPTPIVPQRPLPVQPPMPPQAQQFKPPVFAPLPEISMPLASMPQQQAPPA